MEKDDTNVCFGTGLIFTEYIMTNFLKRYLFILNKQSYSFIYLNLCINVLFWVVLGLLCWAGFSLVAASGGSSPVAGCRLLTATASLAAEHRLGSTSASEVTAPGLQNGSSVVAAHRPSCTEA